MVVNAPTLKTLRGVAESLHLALDDQALAEHAEIMSGMYAAYRVIDDLTDEKPPVKWPRGAGSAPARDDNPLGAWSWMVRVEGATQGPLSGREVVLKDNIQLAGVPMWNGSSTLDGYVPDIDATVVERVLDAGGTIIGKAHCEHFCLSGGSHTNSFHPVRNPHDPTRSSGGSSSGCGALVGSGEVDMAIACDQGGSIRMPSSWSGCVGMKSTWGLVPYTGIMAIDATIDHVGPVTRTVADNALLLEALAGPDGLDPRQSGATKKDYVAATEQGAAGLRVAIISEGFGRAESEPEVDTAVRAAADILRSEGVVVDEVSLPWHVTGAAIWIPIAIEGLLAQMMLGDGSGHSWKGLYSESLAEAHRGWRNLGRDLSPSLVSCMLTAGHITANHGTHYYARAQNLGRRVRREHDAVLAKYDALLMPTMPMRATPLPSSDASLTEIVTRAFEMTGNTCPTDVTGHPAISVPCAMRDGLPVGMMLIGRHYDEPTLYRLAAAFEAACDWRVQ